MVDVRKALSVATPRLFSVCSYQCNFLVYCDVPRDICRMWQLYTGGCFLLSQTIGLPSSVLLTQAAASSLKFQNKVFPSTIWRCWGLKLGASVYNAGALQLQLYYDFLHGWTNICHRSQQGRLFPLPPCTETSL